MTAITPTITFAPLPGPIQLSYLDTNFTQLAAAINTLGIISATGNVVTGPPTSGTMFTVLENVGATALTLINCAIDSVGNANNYVQTDVHNSYAGALASSDVVATADTGSDTSQFVDMGINSSAWSSASWTVSGALDAYLYASDGNLTVGTGGASKSLIFHTGGLLAANIRGTITSAGAWSISVATSGTTLTVAAGTATASQNTILNNSRGTMFDVSTVNGPAWRVQGLNTYNSYLGIGEAGVTNLWWIGKATGATGVLNIGAGSSEGTGTALISVTQAGAITATGTLGFNGAAGAAALTGWGTPVGNAVIASYNITDAGGANSNTNKAVAQIIASLKALGVFAT